MFTTGMKNKWGKLVYIDLFAGAGFAKIKETGRILKSSALIALSTSHKFDKYILCEEDEGKLFALKTRIERDFPNVNVEYVLGDSNKNVNKIISLIPRENCLRFCFVDPFSLNLRFETIERLSRVGKIDFLILLALLMDANRNFSFYMQKNSKKIEEFIKDPNWRKPFETGELGPKDFIRYLSDKYDFNMKNLGYVKPVEKHLVKIEDKNIPLYYLAFYSKNPRGNDFFQKVEKPISPQQKLF
ncbi:MAG: hypothetical protein C4308_12785 [Chitinophagaceae bacterium]